MKSSVNAYGCRRQLSTGQSAHRKSAAKRASQLTSQGGRRARAARAMVATKAKTSHRRLAARAAQRATSMRAARGPVSHVAAFEWERAREMKGRGCGKARKLTALKSSTRVSSAKGSVTQ